MREPLTDWGSDDLLQQIMTNNTVCARARARACVCEGTMGHTASHTHARTRTHTRVRTRAG